MYKEFETYIDSIIPSNSKSSLSEMKEEFINHLEDSAEHYILLGYSEKDAIEKSIKDFGSANLIKKEVFFMKKNSFFILTNIVIAFFTLVTFSSLYCLLKVGFPLEYFNIINPFTIIKVVALTSLAATVYIFISKKKVSNDSLLLKNELTRILSILVIAFFFITCLSIYFASFSVQPILPFALNPWHILKFIALISLIITIAIAIYKKRNLEIVE